MYTTVEFIAFGNIMFPEGVKNEDGKHIENVVKRELGLYSYKIKFVDKVKINGISVAVVGYDDEFQTEHNIYVYATEENVCLVHFTLYELDGEDKLIDKILSSFVINGTYFDGETPENPHDFSNSENYYKAVDKYSADYYDESAAFNESFSGIFALLGFLVLSGPVIVILLIVFIVLWRKQKKIVKEYEDIFGPIGVAQAQFNRFSAMNGNFGDFNSQEINNPQNQNTFNNEPFVDNNFNNIQNNNSENGSVYNNNGEKSQAILNGEAFNGKEN